MAPGSQLKFNGSLNPDAPNDMFSAWGKNGQYINVIPSQKLVLIRMGNAPGGSGAASMAVGFNNEIWQYVNRLPCKNRVSQFENSQITISPNPVKPGSTLMIQTNESDIIHPSIVWEITLFDPAGREISSFKTNNLQQFTIPIHLASGIYYVQISNNLQFRKIKRIMISE
jgi:hypothetical protein